MAERNLNRFTMATVALLWSVTVIILLGILQRFVGTDLTAAGSSVRPVRGS